MADRFLGTVDELRAIVAATGIRGKWSEPAGGQQLQFRAMDGAILNWWSSTGTIQFQGKADTRDKLRAAFGTALTQQPSGAPPLVIDAPRRGRQIFVVHGHDTTARDQLELALHRLGLEPFILMNSSGGGKTIIEALEGHIGRDFSSDFGIVLMTPDDVGYAKADGEVKKEPRARQNVILETGMLLASLTRQRMALLVKGHIEIPSDLQGLIRFNFNDHVREVVPKLCQRLKEAGIEIDAARISAAAS